MSPWIGAEDRAGVSEVEGKRPKAPPNREIDLGACVAAGEGRRAAAAPGPRCFLLFGSAVLFAFAFCFLLLLSAFAQRGNESINRTINEINDLKLCFLNQ